MASRIRVAIVESILRLREQGWSFRSIAQALGGQSGSGVAKSRADIIESRLEGKKG